MKKLVLVLAFIGTMLLGQAQVVRIQFEQCDRSMERVISKAVSIDRRDGCVYTAYANPQELAAFEQLGIPYEVVPPEENLTKAEITAATSLAEMEGWNKYPSYSVYMQMMQNWATNYPKLCKIDTISHSTTNNHKIICLKISDNPNDEEAEPEFFYMSSMHGDEVTGFYFLLRMIDTLLTSYNVDSTLTNLVNTTQIYICPDANPDGTYLNGDDVIYKPNSTSDLSGRYNGNNIDLNRTYPDPFSSTAYQTQYDETEQENKDMIQYMNAHHFVMAACMHGGAEILNFPWDTYASSDRSLADAAWWTAMGNRFVATLRQYTGTASNNSNTFPNNLYRTERIGSGWSASYTEQCFGGDWYAISGGWQDYSNWYNHIRAFTIEVSRTKCPEISGTWGVKNYWYYQKEPLINLIKEVHEGVHGFVVDSVTREPLRAFIEVVNHDADSSQIYSRHVLGDYYRPIADGTYSFRASCHGYVTKTYTNVTAAYGTPTELIIELVPEGWTPVEYTVEAVSEDNAKGTVTGGGTYLGGQIATITATANTGYEFDHWNDGNTENPRSFTVSEDVSYTAYFATATYTVTVESEDEAKGTATGGGTYNYGETASISANPAEHYEFAQWSDGNTENPRTVTVTGDTAYTAQFSAVSYTITAVPNNADHGQVSGSGTYAYGNTASLEATAANGYHFTQWNDGNTDNPRTVTVTGNATYTATFEIESYTITVNAQQHGSATGSGSYTYGSAATLEATADEGYHFTQWNDGNTDNPRYLTVTATATYTAQFEINTYTITIQPNNAAYGTTIGSNTYTHGQTVTATATPADGYRFDGWSNGSTDNPYTFPATGDLTLIANFAAQNSEPVYYTLTVVSDNSSMGSAGESGTYLQGSVVSISATAATGYHFTQWNDGNTDNPRNVTVTGNATYTAYFAAESYTVSVTPDNASHGTTTPNGSSTYAYGTPLTISATANDGYHFVSWNDGNIQASRTVTVTGNSTYIATFAANRYNITVTANNITYGNTTGSGTYNYGEQVPISATASEGHSFSQWSDGNTQNPRTVTVTGDATYTAIFTTVSHQLTVQPDDASHGTTTPNGTTTHTYGEQVSITATAANGYRFRQWSDGNQYPIRTVTVTGNATYTAYFDAIEYTVTVRPNNVICGSTTPNGSTTHSYMDEVTATASPAEGFVFDHWSNGSTENPYTFNVTGTVTLIAVFVTDGSGSGTGDTEGIDGVETQNYSVYPNPTTGIVHISSPAPTQSNNQTIKLYNIYGQLLQQLPAGATSVNLSNYSNGTYFLRIGEATTKIVKY